MWRVFYRLNVDHEIAKKQRFYTKNGSNSLVLATTIQKCVTKKIFLQLKPFLLFKIPLEGLRNTHFEQHYHLVCTLLKLFVTEKLLYLCILVTSELKQVKTRQIGNVFVDCDIII